MNYLGDVKQKNNCVTHTKNILWKINSSHHCDCDCFLLQIEFDPILSRSSATNYVCERMSIQFNVK